MPTSASTSTLPEVSFNPHFSSHLPTIPPTHPPDRKSIKSPTWIDWESKVASKLHLSSSLEPATKFIHFIADCPIHFLVSFYCNLTRKLSAQCLCPLGRKRFDPVSNLFKMISIYKFLVTLATVLKRFFVFIEALNRLFLMWRVVNEICENFF